MKKIAFFVEGQTEQLFINKLLKEVAGYKNISITLKEIVGGGTRKQKPRIENIISQPEANPSAFIYEALIYDCHNDERVKSEMLDNIYSMATQGYTHIVGIRDLYPKTLTDLSKLDRGLKFIPLNKRPLPIQFDIIVAIHEIEAWFLSEYSHFERINPRLTEQHILSNVGFNPFADDMTLRYHPAQDLDDIYKLVALFYHKKYKHIKRTVDSLDYTELYLKTRYNVSKLDELLTIIDNFLT